ncbi:carboxypeptidase-like regulatory domain-containing protein [Sphingobacteriales bacterium UPWRP_1]|nr:hypothetical protein B6N25_10765 [Sphingobacteriales bacterium TSM_CSS]PSJ72179.1 carboxypeptidase-like regulatory domain-containing protein [Sphingobacteriales bacterium UPWRP_1]
MEVRNYETMLSIHFVPLLPGGKGWGVVFFLLLLLTGATGNLALAQEIEISGKVIDDATQESVPFANVFLQNTTIGTVTDMDGNFYLKTQRLSDSLGVSSVGYAKRFKYVSAAPTQNIVFRIVREDIVMQEFTVVAGENPADIMMRKIIAQKNEHSIEKNETYQVEVYNKIEVDVTDLNKKITTRKVMKPFSFIFDNVDSLSEEKPFLPIFLTESLSDFYYNKDPKLTKEVIKASKISGVENESVTQFLGNMYQKIDIYEDWMPVMGKNFPSPISDQALFYYKYSLIDSSAIDNHWSYHLTFKPRREQGTAFTGDFWVCDTVFALRRINMHLDGKNVNINFIEKLNIYQEFAETQNNIWALVKDKLVVDFIAAEKAPGVIGRKSTYFKNFVFNSPHTKKILENKEDIVVSENVFDKPEEFWLTARHDSLSANEKAIYAMIDTIKNIPIAKTYINIVTTIVSGYKIWGPVEIGPYFSMVSADEVEGWRVRLGGRTSNDFSTRIMLSGYGAYGFKDKRFKYGADALVIVNRKPWQTLYAGYKNDLDIQSNNVEEFGQDNLLAGLYRRKVPQKLTNIKSAELSYSRDWKRGLSNKITLNHRIYQPQFDFYFLDEVNPLTPPDSTITTSEIQFNTRFAFKEKFVSGKFTRISLGSDYPIVNFTYTLGIKGILNSEFNYHRLDLSVYDWFYVGPMGYTSYQFTAGKIFGKLPFLLLENFPGNETFFYNRYSFNRMNEYEFTADTYASLLLTHHFDGIFFNRVPLLRKLKLRELITAKVAVGNLNNENRNANYDAGGTYKNFGDLFAKWNLPDWQIQTPTIQKPYVEVGVGIENILKIFRIDAVWRLTYTDKPGRVGIRTGMQLVF